MSTKTDRRGALGRLAAAALAGVVSGKPDVAEAAPLAAFAWRARPILIFAPSIDHPSLAAQSALFATRMSDLVDRACPLVVIAGDVVTIDGAAAPQKAEALRRHYGVAPDAFALLLVGKDTGVKLRRAEPTEPDEIFALIDRMPMRRREMRE